MSREAFYKDEIDILVIELDKLGIPKADKHGVEYSLWGRVQAATEHQKQVDADICLSIADKYASSMEEAVDDDRTMFADLSNGASECYEAIREQGE